MQLAPALQQARTCNTFWLKQKLVRSPLLKANANPNLDKLSQSMMGMVLHVLSSPSTMPTREGHRSILAFFHFQLMPIPLPIMSEMIMQRASTLAIGTRESCKVFFWQNAETLDCYQEMMASTQMIACEQGNSDDVSLLLIKECQSSTKTSRRCNSSLHSKIRKVIEALELMSR